MQLTVATIKALAACTCNAISGTPLMDCVVLARLTCTCNNLNTLITFVRTYTPLMDSVWTVYVRIYMQTSTSHLPCRQYIQYSKVERHRHTVLNIITNHCPSYVYRISDYSTRLSPWPSVCPSASKCPRHPVEGVCHLPPASRTAWAVDMSILLSW